MYQLLHETPCTQLKRREDLNPAWGVKNCHLNALCTVAVTRRLEAESGLTYWAPLAVIEVSYSHRLNLEGDEAA